MSFTDEQLNQIFDRASGKCHLCHKKLAFKNYAKSGERGAWEVDHSHAVAIGGSDHLNNLYPAHISCNRKKQARSSRSVRKANGKQRPPMSKAQRQKAQRVNTATGTALGVTLGAAIGGPPGAILGGLIGAGIGSSAKPRDV